MEISCIHYIDENQLYPLCRLFFENKVKVCLCCTVVRMLNEYLHLAYLHRSYLSDILRIPPHPRTLPYVKRDRACKEEKGEELGHKM